MFLRQCRADRILDNIAHDDIPLSLSFEIIPFGTVRQIQAVRVKISSADFVMKKLRTASRSHSAPIIQTPLILPACVDAGSSHTVRTVCQHHLYRFFSCGQGGLAECQTPVFRDA